jgi:hypothetical protein
MTFIWISAMALKRSSKEARALASYASRYDYSSFGITRNDAL